MGRWSCLARLRHLHERRRVWLGDDLRDALFDPCGFDHRAGVDELGLACEAVAVSAGVVVMRKESADFLRHP
jgi:hypothetical protein